MGIPSAPSTSSSAAHHGGAAHASSSSSASSPTSLRSNNDPEFASLFEDAVHRATSSASASTDATAAALTPEEQQSFLHAMQDSEFRSLLHDYMEEISDPKNRAETEQYLRQLEQEQHVPKHRQLVRPTPGFVVKTLWHPDGSDQHNGTKLFVNVCSSKLVQPPSSTAVEANAAAGKHGGTSWRLPYSLGPLRWEGDKRGAKVQTLDVCFHPTTVKMAKNQQTYRDMVVHTALDAVELQMRDVLRKPHGALVRQPYRVLRGIAYKSGEPVTMCVKLDEGDEVEEEKPVAQKPNTHEMQKEHEEKGVQAEKPLIEVVSSEISESTTLKAPVQIKALPELSFQVIHRGRFDMLDHVETTDQVSLERGTQRPRELLVDISFPNTQTSAAGIDLDVSEREVVVAGKDFAPLRVKLPFPVIEARGTAKFDKLLHRLRVTLPVQAPPPPSPKSASIQAVQEDEAGSDSTDIEDNQDEHDKPLDADVGPNKDLSNKQNEQAKRPFVSLSPATVEDDAFRMFRETAQMVRQDPLFQARHNEEQCTTNSPPSPSSPIPTPTPSAESPVTCSPPISLDAAIDQHVASNAELFDDLPPLEDVPELASVASPQVETIVSPKKLQAKTPPFSRKETATHCSFIIHQANIDAATVAIAFDTDCRVQFSTLDSGESMELVIDMHQLSVDASRAEWHVASENMMLTVPKRSTVAQSSPPTLAPVAHFQNLLLYDLD